MDSKDTLIGYVQASANRHKVLKVLSKGRATPTQISDKTGILPTNTSRILKQLSSKDMVKCTTFGLRKGKLFVLTEMGQTILDEL